MKNHDRIFVKQRLVNSEHLPLEPGRLQSVVKFTCGGVAGFKLTHDRQAPIEVKRYRVRGKSGNHLRPTLLPSNFDGSIRSTHANPGLCERVIREKNRETVPKRSDHRSEGKPE